MVLTDNTTLVLGFPENEGQARLLSDELGCDVDIVAVRRFPDGESLVRVPPRIPARLVVIRSLDHPDTKIVELLLALETLRDRGAEHITFIAPYLCYMRQDMEFNPGEAVSQRIIGRFLGTKCDALITVDPHLHRISELQEVVPAHPAVALTAASIIGAFLKEKLDRPILLGPDSESEQWVAEVARQEGLDYCVADKSRLGDRSVIVELPDLNLRGYDVVIIDDIASSGYTLAEAAKSLKGTGCASINAVVTHVLFDEDAARRFTEAGIANIWSTDTIPHASNAVSVVPLLADAVRSLIPAPA